MMRRGTPEGFPKGLDWETVRQGTSITAIRCVGFNNDQQLTHQIASHIRAELRDKPCTITGSTANVEIDHRAGNKEHLLHIYTDDVTKQTVDDFMPLCRSVNQIKREACKQCVASHQRPDLPPFLGGGPMKSGAGCFGCFWMQPELYS